MTLEYALIVVLLGLVVFQNVHFSRIHKNLIDRLMSRNYAEYVSVTKPPHPTVKLPDFDSVEEKEVLSQLNGMLGV